MFHLLNQITSYLRSSEELGHSFAGMVFGSILLLHFFSLDLLCTDHLRLFDHICPERLWVFLSVLSDS